MSRAAAPETDSQPQEAPPFNQVNLDEYKLHLKQIERQVHHKTADYHTLFKEMSDSSHNPEASRVLVTTYLLVYLKTYIAIFKKRNEKESAWWGSRNTKYAEILKTLGDSVKLFSDPKDATIINFADAINDEDHQPLLGILKSQTTLEERVESTADKDDSKLRSLLIANIHECVIKMTENAEALFRASLGTAFTYDDLEQLDRSSHDFKKRIRDGRLKKPEGIDDGSAYLADDVVEDIQSEDVKLPYAFASGTQYYTLYIQIAATLKNISMAIGEMHGKDNTIDVMQRNGGGEIGPIGELFGGLTSYLAECESNDSNPFLPKKEFLDHLLAGTISVTIQDQFNTLRAGKLATIKADKSKKKRGGHKTAKKTMTLKDFTLKQGATLPLPGNDGAAAAADTSSKKRRGKKRGKKSVMQTAPVDSTLKRKLKTSIVVKATQGGVTLRPGAKAIVVGGKSIPVDTIKRPAAAGLAAELAEYSSASTDEESWGDSGSSAPSEPDHVDPDTLAASAAAPPQRPVADYTTKEGADTPAVEPDYEAPESVEVTVVAPQPEPTVGKDWGSLGKALLEGVRMKKAAADKKTAGLFTMIKQKKEERDKRVAEQTAAGDAAGAENPQRLMPVRGACTGQTDVDLDAAADTDQNATKRTVSDIDYSSC